MKTKVDPKLEKCFNEGMNILKENQKLLLHYSDYKSLTKAMYKIKEVVSKYKSYE